MNFITYLNLPVTVIVADIFVIKALKNPRFVAKLLFFLVGTKFYNFYNNRVSIRFSEISLIENYGYLLAKNSFTETSRTKSLKGLQTVCFKFSNIIVIESRP